MQTTRRHIAKGGFKGLLEATTMYMSNSTLEKLLDGVREKVIGTTAKDTVDGARGLVTSGLSSAATVLIRAKRTADSSSSEEEDAEDQEDDVDNVQVFKTDRVFCHSNDQKTTNVIENGINLTGPVTDL